MLLGRGFGNDMVRCGALSDRYAALLPIEVSSTPPLLTIADVWDISNQKNLFAWVSRLPPEVGRKGPLGGRARRAQPVTAALADRRPVDVALLVWRRQEIRGRKGWTARTTTRQPARSARWKRITSRSQPISALQTLVSRKKVSFRCSETERSEIPYGLCGCCLL